ncbi:hypothetical protein NK905_23860, partial [Salmonella enterica subsp. enterica serovar Typhimurium]|uniref:hypothetical protein n=1 Tax=Salmonella enterica TaxID=28901 RepID=UPI0020A435D0
GAKLIVHYSDGDVTTYDYHGMSGLFTDEEGIRPYIDGYNMVDVQAPADGEWVVGDNEVTVEYARVTCTVTVPLVVPD